jgi:hypothetical protein
MTVAVQQLRDREKEQPEAEHCGENAEDKDGRTAPIDMIVSDVRLIHRWTGCRTQTDTRAEGGHEQERDADDDADVEHSDGSLFTPKMRPAPLN